MVRIGFVGVGNMGQAAHLRNYATLPDCQVLAIAEPRRDLAARVAARFGIQHVFASAEEMVAAVQLDGLVASQPFDRHGSIVVPLYRYGLPVFTEKPLASSVEMGERMIAELERFGSWHMVGYHKRNDPAVVWALQRISELGPPRYVRITMPPGDWIGGGFDELIRTDEVPPALAEDPRLPYADADFVAFVNYYIHQVNLLRFLLGEAYRLTYADPNRRLLVAETDSGQTGVIEMAPYETTLGWDESILVGFEKAALRVNLVAPVATGRCGSAELLQADGTTVSPRLPAVSAMRMQAQNFIDAIAGRDKAACEAAEALEDLRIARQWRSQIEA